MNYGTSPVTAPTETPMTAQPQRYRLADLDDLDITVVRASEARGDFGPYLILTARIGAAPETVEVTTGSKPVREWIERWFEAHPGEPVRVVPQRRTSKAGRQYWTLLQVDDALCRPASANTGRSHA